MDAKDDRPRYVCEHGVENCCMPGEHLADECHTPEMLESSYAGEAEQAATDAELEETRKYLPELLRLAGPEPLRYDDILKIEAYFPILAKRCAGLLARIEADGKYIQALEEQCEMLQCCRGQEMMNRLKKIDALIKARAALETKP